MLNVVLIALPVYAVGRVGYHRIKLLVDKGHVGECVAVTNVGIDAEATSNLGQRVKRVVEVFAGRLNLA